MPAPTPATAELELIRGAAAGDAHAFDELVRLHHRRVYNFLFQFTRNRHDAEDLTQQTFIKAYRNFGRFEPSRPLINWLLTIARHGALNLFRDTRRWSELSWETADAEPSPAATTEMHDRSARLWDRARAALSPREFEVLWLRFAEDLSTEETARITGLTGTHIKVLVHRSRQKLLKGEL